ncbi:PilZ domain-containing protein [bacterium]|nr:PilZ domain-containing protein [bacterium]
MSSERRREERIQPVFRVRTEVLPEKGDIHMAVFADIINLSQNGVCLRSPLKLKEKAKLIVYLPDLESKNPLELHGLVRWIKESGPLMFEYGMEFSGIEKFTEYTIHGKIKKIMTAYYEQQSMRIE